MIKNILNAIQAQTQENGANKDSKKMNSDNTFGAMLEGFLVSDDSKKTESTLIKKFIEDQKETNPTSQAKNETPLLLPTLEAKILPLKTQILSININGEKVDFVGTLTEKQSESKLVRNIVNKSISQKLNLKEIIVRTFNEGKENGNLQHLKDTGLKPNLSKVKIPQTKELLQLYRSNIQQNGSEPIANTNTKKNTNEGLKHTIPPKETHMKTAVNGKTKSEHKNQNAVVDAIEKNQFDVKENKSEPKHRNTEIIKNEISEKANPTQDLGKNSAPKGKVTTQANPEKLDIKHQTEKLHTHKTEAKEQKTEVKNPTFGENPRKDVVSMPKEKDTLVNQKTLSEKPETHIRKTIETPKHLTKGVSEENQHPKKSMDTVKKTETTEVVLQEDTETAKTDVRQTDKTLPKQDTQSQKPEKKPETKSLFIKNIIETKQEKETIIPEVTEQTVMLKLKDLENRNSLKNKLAHEVAKNVAEVSENKPKVTEIKITLEPKSLGKIEITLKGKNKNLDLSIKVSNKGVEGLLTESMISLKEKIEASTTLTMREVNIYTEPSKSIENNIQHRRVEENYQQEHQGQQNQKEERENKENKNKKEDVELNFEELREELSDSSSQK